MQVHTRILWLFSVLATINTSRPYLWEHHSQCWQTVPRAKVKTTHSRLWKRPDCPGKAERRGSSKAGKEELRCSRWEADLEQGCSRGDGDRDPDAERSTGRFSQSLNEDQRVEKSWLSCLRRPLEKFGIHNKNTEHKGPGGEMELQLHQAVEKKIQRWRGLTAKQGYRNRKAGLQGRWTTFMYKQQSLLFETQFIFHGVGPSSYSTVIVDLCRSLSRDNPLLNSRNLTHVQLKVTSGH